MSTDPKECPHCSIGKAKSGAPGVTAYTCGSAMVDGEIRLGPNCEQYVKNVAESEDLKRQLAEAEQRV